MSRTFDDSLDSDLSNAFFNANEFAQSVTISRGALSTAGVASIVVERSYDTVDHGGIMTSVEATDFEFQASAYQISATTTDPRPGDRFTTSAGEKFEAVTLAGLQCFQSHSDGRVIRVHTKRVK